MWLKKYSQAINEIFFCLIRMFKINLKRNTKTKKLSFCFNIIMSKLYFGYLYNHEITPCILNNLFAI